MSTFRKIALPALAALSVLGGAGAASAQSYYGPVPYAGPAHVTPAAWGDRDHYNGRFNGRADAIRDQIAQLEMRVNRNDNRDRISDREAWGLRREVRDIREQFRMFNRDGLNDREFRVLQDRIDHARSRLHFERSDRDGRRW